MTISELKRRLLKLESERQINNPNVSITLVLNTEDSEPNKYLINGIPATEKETKQIEESLKNIKPIPNTTINIEFTND